MEEVDLGSMPRPCNEMHCGEKEMRCPDAIWASHKDSHAHSPCIFRVAPLAFLNDTSNNGFLFVIRTITPSILGHTLLTRLCLCVTVRLCLCVTVCWDIGQGEGECERLGKGCIVIGVRWGRTLL